METLTETPKSLVVHIDPKEFGLDESKAVEIESVFAPVIAERNALMDVYNHLLTMEMSLDATSKARDLRLKLVKIRTNTDKIHKASKAFYLAGSRFVDAWKNKNNVVVEQMEEKCSEIENYYENIKKKQIAELQAARIGQIKLYVDEIGLSAMTNLGSMPETQFNALLAGYKAQQEAKIAAEKKAEEDRIAKEKADTLHKKRKDEILEYWAFVPIEHRQQDFSEFTEEEWKERVEWTIQQKKDNDAKVLEDAKKIVKEEVVREVKAEVKKEVIQEVKAEVREEVKAEVKKEVKQEFRTSSSFRTEIKKEVIQEISKVQEEANLQAELAPDKQKLETLAAELENYTMPELKSKKAKQLAEDTKVMIATAANHIRTNLKKI